MVLLVIILLALAAVGYKAYKKSTTVAAVPAPDTSNQTAAAPIQTSPQEAGTSAVVTSGDPGIDADSQAIDNSLNSVDQSLNQVDSGLNDKSGDLTVN